MTDFAFSYTFAGLCDIGKQRSSNQDRIILVPKHDFFAVSDGMGGLRFGEASAEYVSGSMPMLMDILAEKCDGNVTPPEAAEMLESAAGTLSDELFKKGNSPNRFDYGATLAGVWLFDEKAIFVGLGDSRGYVLRDGVLKQVTEDMNIAGLLVRNGAMTREEAEGSPASSRLTAFVGMESPAEPMTWLLELQPGDRILLCSDGLYGLVPEGEITGILKEEAPLEELCRKLIGRANENGGRDNISAVVIRIEEK